MREHTAPDWQPLNVDTEPHEPSMLSLDPAEELIEARAVLMEALRPPSWHARALCRGVGPDRWFPARGRPAGPGVEACKVCEVRSECLDHALDAGPDLHGIWGGTTRAQRRAMLRQAG